MAETKTYTGSCHCGQVAYEADADLNPVISCNCSICRKRGAILAFVPEDKFRLKSGGETLTDYQFNKKVIHHMFCPTCGVGRVRARHQARWGKDGRPQRALPRRRRPRRAQHQ